MGIKDIHKFSGGAGCDSRKSYGIMSICLQCVE